MATLTPEEEAIQAATLRWQRSPEVLARKAQVLAILRIEMEQAGESAATPAWMTRTLQIWIALDQVNKLDDVDAFMRRNKMWPFDGSHEFTGLSVAQMRERKIFPFDKAA